MKIENLTNLIYKALEAVKQATSITYTSSTPSELKRIMLELAENGACDNEYEGDGYFSVGYNSIHINEMSDTYVARTLIRNYAQ
ncbi:hypothetical protein [Paenibacillus polymyxa]|uniref:hypothetical protein n=1 Tax=Paenibacillus polymyxa TaxID=1406 RepID=UPI0003FC7EB5|nr:hypothetical protein [Paenibacillus polymyxa]